MDIDVRWVDVRPYLLQGIQPVYMLERPKAHPGPKAWAGPSEVGRLGEHWVPQMNAAGGLDWSMVQTGDWVRIPIVAYRTQARALASILGMGLQIALAAMAELRNHTTDVPTRAVVVMGHEVTDLDPEDAFRCYVGLALQTK